MAVLRHGTIAAELNLSADICFAIAGTYDFAAGSGGKKKNCNPVKSHFCVGKKGTGSCVPLTKKCAIPATGVALQAAMAIDQQSPPSQAKKVASPESEAYKIPESGRDAVIAADFDMDFGLNAINEIAGFSMAEILGSPSKDEANALIKSDIAAGRIAQGSSEKLLIYGPDNAAMQALGSTRLNDDDDFTVVGWDGEKATPLTPSDKTVIAEARKRWQLHQEAFSAVEDIQVEIGLSSIMYPKSKSKILASVADELKEHKAATQKLWTSEDKALGRTPSKQSRKKLEGDVKAEAEAWAKSMGFNEGGGVNGFSANATKAHDVAHPATHRLTGLDSGQINKVFGGLKDPDGKPSLLAEESLVNIVEHLSRGDTKEASIQNGLRLAKVLSRNGTQEEQDYVRTSEFARGIIDLVDNRIYKNNEYSNLMPIVRDYNTIAGTVTVSGSNFSTSASGG
jgi:hypothetical protein